MTLYRVTIDRPDGAFLYKGDIVEYIEDEYYKNVDVLKPDETNMSVERIYGVKGWWLSGEGIEEIEPQKPVNEHKQALKEKYGV